MSKGSILVVDDESEIREGLEILLKGEGYGVASAETAESGLAKLEEHPFDLLLLDVSLPDRNGLDMLKEIRRRDPDLSVVLITAYGSIDMARAAFKNGAMDYITKPWSNEELLAQVAQAVESRRLRDENRHLKRALKQRFNFPNIIGKSEKMQVLLDLVAQVAPSRSTVLISGESGTGKELIAKALHSASPRADKAFVPVNTGSIPVDLLESQLFGHVKGAFTSAVASKKGLFEVADQGTIFFDEIATISPETQAKLLRVIQEREFMRLGGTEQIKVDVRIVAASNVELLTLVREGRFREDLFHRLNVIHLRIPPLRERREDVPLLVLHFLERFSTENNRAPMQFTPNAMKLMMDYDWPGNVRELENVVERAVVLSTQNRIDVDLLPEAIRSKEIVRGVRLQLSEFLPALPGEPGARTAADNPHPSLFQIMDEVERRIIVDMLERTNWNQTEAAERFLIPLSTLNQKIKRLNIEVRRRGRDEALGASSGK
ncbi:MAG: DNA-binding response regulator [Acidobacteria bacterium]|nr:MAG: DNA-binding response regulator [Acidobacteria bacterium 13_2_20CM_58_27]PYT75306.1 MAG: DNA-binding response regulator [Acidobacteriota bacterium]PYT86481.1 MAG: DNA-binding response regulator [Acidobacteriota bacterium]